MRWDFCREPRKAEDDEEGIVGAEEAHEGKEEEEGEIKTDEMTSEREGKDEDEDDEAKEEGEIIKAGFERDNHWLRNALQTETISDRKSEESFIEKLYEGCEEKTESAVASNEQ